MTRAELGELIETVKKRRDEITDYLCDCDSYFRGRRYECKWFLSFLEKYYERDERKERVCVCETTEGSFYWNCPVHGTQKYYERKKEEKHSGFRDEWDKPEPGAWITTPENKIEVIERPKRRGAREIWDLI